MKLLLLLLLPLVSIAQIKTSEDVKRIDNIDSKLSSKSTKKDFFSYYPNPVKDLLSIELKDGAALKRVNIYNAQSQLLYYTTGLKVDTRNLNAGVYFLEVETNKGISAEKIVVNN